MEVTSDNILTISIISGSLFYVFTEKILTPYFLRPLCYILTGIQHDTKDEKNRFLVEEKFPMHIIKAVSCSIMFYYRLIYFQKYSGWEDIANWTYWMAPPGPSDETEIAYILGPTYVYFSFAIWVFLKDSLKKRKYNGLADYLFDFHHIITIILVWYSNHSGYIRAGFLFRAIFDITDIVLYCTKCFESIYKPRTGLQHSFALLICMTNFWITWIFTRVVLYAWFNLAVFARSHRLWLSGDMDAFVYDLPAPIFCFLMFVLQVVWAWFITEMWLKYFNKKETNDWMHNDMADSEKETCNGIQD